MKVRLRHRQLARHLAEGRLTQNAWARRIGVSEGHLSNLVNGNRPHPNAATRKKLLEALHLDFDDLFELEIPEQALGSSKAKASSQWLRNRMNRFEKDEMRRIFQELWKDIQYAFRSIKGKGGFSLVVVLILAIGIGATTAMFGSIKATLLSSLPFDEPDQLVMGRTTFDGNLNPWVSGYDYYDYRDQSQSFESLAAFMFYGRVTVLSGNEPERVESVFVTWDLFPTLRVRPAIGRFFAEEEGTEGASKVIVISNGYWQRRFGASPDTIGSTLIMNGSAYTIIGVLPSGFHFLTDADIWRLTYYNGPGADARRWHNLLLVGRLKAGVTIEQAQSEVDAISHRLEEQYPETNEGKALRLTGLHDTMVESSRSSLLTLMVVVSLVLLLACGNVAGLFLARGQTRLMEMAVRSAMGASRWRLVRQLLTESLIISLVAGLGGVALAFGFQQLLVRLLPLGEIGITRPSIDTPVLLFCLGISLATGIIFGAVPAVQGTVVELSQNLKARTRSTSTRGGSLFRNGLVVFQVSISMMLLIGAGLLIRSLTQQTKIDLGFNPSHLLTARVELPNDYADPEKRIAFFRSFVEEVEALRGVVSAGVVNRLPILEPSGNIYVYPADQPAEQRESRMSRSADFRCVLPGYLRTMGIPLLSGRDIDETDREDSPRVMIISESMVQEFFAGQNPLGKKLIVDMGEMVPHEVVGVVADTRLNQLTSEPRPAMYMSYDQVPRNSMRLVVRSAGDPTALTGSVREILRAKDRNIPLAEPATMASIVDDKLSNFRIITSSLGLFSAIALLLALVGLYGVLAYYVSQRSHEIGVRMALGASARQVASLVLSRGIGLVALGLVIGLVGSYWASHLIEGLLYGVESTDLVTFLVVTVGFCAVALGACLLPAWRATRVDPATTLQVE